MKAQIDQPPRKRGEPQWKSTPGPLNSASSSHIPPAVPTFSRGSSKGQAPETPHLSGVGILNDAQIARARALGLDKPSGYARSKRSVKSLNLPLQ
jgi:hypothetical protein